MGHKQFHKSKPELSNFMTTVKMNTAQGSSAGSVCLTKTITAKIVLVYELLFTLFIMSPVQLDTRTAVQISFSSGDTVKVKNKLKKGL